MFEGIRAKYNQKSPWIGLASIAFILAIVAWQFRAQLRQQLGPPMPPPSVWFYELDSGTLFIAPDILPDNVRSPTGKAAVRAAVFSCGSCDVPEQRFAGWLEREELIAGRVPTSETEVARVWRAAREEDDQGTEAPIRLWIRPPLSKTWAPRVQSTVDLLMQAVEKHCADAKGKVVPCPAK